MITRNQKYLIGAAIAAVVIIIGIVIAKNNGEEAPKTNATYTLAAAPTPFQGRADASIVVDEYADFQCPACRTAVPYVDALVKQYGDNVRFNYRYFPLESIHANALISAEAGACANDQGKFWPMYSIMFENQTALGRSSLIGYAKTVGLDVDQFTACLDTKARLDVVRADQDSGDKLGLNGTPSFVLNGTQVVSLKDLEKELRKNLGLPEVVPQ